ncbi:MAG: hypothetical protein WA940_00260 [Sphingopyxis sp.]
MFTLPTKYDELEWWERRAVREQYASEQDGKCWHCKGPLDGKPEGADANMRVTRRLFPASFFKHPVHLHHCHRTGMTIGAVHNHCNAVLWERYGQ